MTSDTLSTDEIQDILASLETDGYAVVRGVVDPAKLQEFADHLDSEFARAGEDDRLFDGGGSITGHLNCFPGRASRFIYDAIAERGILRVVEAVTPDNLDQIRVTTNYNLPESKVQHFHSDGLYTEAFLICNVAVVDTDLRNGAIDMIPGTHKRFYKFWR
ncbi:MAG: phytanoyl-CoA dioxygenase family protein, partial [Actinomycetota bacterium]